MAAEYISQSDFQDTDSLGKRFICKVYLVTYNRVNKGKCSNRGRSAEMVLEAFALRKKSSAWPVQRAVSKEPHSQSAFHYHMFVKFSNNKRWYGAKCHVLASCNISVHFNDNHQNYISAYRYMTNEDTDVVLVTLIFIRQDLLKGE